tara:strand:- start:515 stop:775 length:261 start_codon:yes stop_codon:yes gene_type:complete
MLKKIIKTVAFMAFSICLASSPFFSGITPVEAAQMGSNMNEDNNMSIVIEESSDSLDGSKISEVPDLGDDQTFPFIPGFGKNSGKD